MISFLNSLMDLYFVGIIYKEVRWDWNVNCLVDKIGIRSSSCFNDFMKGGHAPDSMNGLSAVMSEYFLLRFSVNMANSFFWDSFHGFL